MIVHNRLIRVLVIDDELLQRKFVSRQLEQLKFTFETATSAADGLEALRKKDFDVVLLDVQMPEMSGLEAIPLIKQLEDSPEVIMLTLDKSLESGLTAMRSGAYDYLTKPASIEELEITIKRAAEKHRLIRQNTSLRDFVENNSSPEEKIAFLLPENARMKKIYEQAGSVSGLNSTILITGESGTGKDVLARFIHNRSSRAKNAMVTVNCGATPETLFESEFFGYEKGAFSGATQTKHGLIEVADGSTLFLDEIGEMPPPLQVKLLRFLESGEFRRVGGTRDLFSDARLIAATNTDLSLAVKENRFREDLFYRLNVIQLHLPPLQERVEDLPSLIEGFLELFRRKFGKPDLDLTPEARRKLLNYDYPGNIRELKNCIERAAALAPEDVIEAGQIFFSENETAGRFSPTTEEEIFSRTVPSADLTAEERIIPLEELERQYIDKILKLTQGNRGRAARLLGISERTLYRRLRDYE
ncbi:MAG: sigma-54 dependent transcriptional regulator [Pyrinomonadaceae bacterium]